MLICSNGFRIGQITASFGVFTVQCYSHRAPMYNVQRHSTFKEFKLIKQKFNLIFFFLVFITCIHKARSHQHLLDKAAKAFWPCACARQTALSVYSFITPLILTALIFKHLKVAVHFARVLFLVSFFSVFFVFFCFLFCSFSMSYDDSLSRVCVFLHAHPPQSLRLRKYLCASVHCTRTVYVCHVD